MLEKIKRKQEELQEEVTTSYRIQDLVQETRFSGDELESHFQQFDRKGISVEISIVEGDIGDLTNSWIFRLTKANMESIYQDAWGWNDKAKLNELSEEDARFLIAMCDRQPIGFVHYRYEQQDGKFVIYIYDIQIEKKYQRKGLGNFMIDALWFVGLKRKVACIMTLVFKNNNAGLQFFKKAGFQPHPTSPENLFPEKENEYQHVILYRNVGRRNKA